MSRPIYLDYMSTTPVAAEVIETMQGCLGVEGVFGNPASKTHVYGEAAYNLVDKARQDVAALINADKREIVFTSGATEADNLALIGAARFHARSGKHIITLKTEHKAVLDACAYLSSEGYDIDYLDVNSDGLVNIPDLEDAIRPDTILVSVMHVNNETGAIQDIARIGALARKRGVLFHVDAAQSAGKIPIDVQSMSVDLLSLSAHKIYGPKGIGALYVCRKPRVRLEPLIHGGGHEWGLRSGTLSTHQIVGMGCAFSLAQKVMQDDSQRIKEMSNEILQALDAVPSVVLHGARGEQYRYLGCFNFRVNGFNAETLMAHFSDFAISQGAACNATQAAPSHVLLAMGCTASEASGSVRISIGRYTNESAIQLFVDKVRQLLLHL